MTSKEDDDLRITPSQWDEVYDLVVLGAGAAGLTAAIVSAIEGNRTLLLEKSDQIGGTSASSSGTIWIPNNSYQRRSGITGDAEAAMQYLDALVGDRSYRTLYEAYIAAGPEMLQYLEDQIDLRWLMYDVQPDYDPELPGATTGGRALMPLPFDGRTLGKHFYRVRWPIPELMLFGGMMITRGEVARLLRIGRNLDSFLLGAKLCGRFILDRIRYKRGTRLVLGNALVARLFKNLLGHRATVWFSARTTRLIQQERRVSGLIVRRDGSEVRVRVKHGIILAGGGFSANRELRERYFPKPVAQYSSAYEGCTGDTLLLGQEIGASLGPLGEDNALWFPSSIATRKDKSTVVFPHIVLDRAKPGLVAVNSAGRRFVDEGCSYHKFVRAMYLSNRDTPSIPAWLVCDRRFVRKYGIGMVMPLTPFLKPFVDRGYLHVADSVEGLARKIGVNAAGLVETVRNHNEFARTGVDTDFGKGGNVYDRAYGDPEHLPNPCLGPINRPPYCAVAVFPTPLGTSLGLLTNAHAQVLESPGQPIKGLYACGNDMQNIFGGEYPGPGAQIGIGMVFGFLAAKHAMGEM
jgi:succinate dehydrogenase/fumarate reductase flavoprotein subunit